MNLSRLLPVSVIVALLGVGCYPVEDSCNIKTPGIYVQFEVLEKGTTARAEATFWTGNDANGTNLSLTCGDVIVVNGTKLKKSSSHPIRYAASIKMTEEYEFVFDRTDEEPYSSFVTKMPEPVSITAPSRGEIPRDQSFEITWENNGKDELNLRISSDCFWEYPETLGKSVPDTGHYTVSANSFDMQSGEDATSCTAEVELTREVKGSLSTDLKGTIRGLARGTATFTSTPAALMTE